MTIDYDELAKRTERGVKGLKVVHGPGSDDEWDDTQEPLTLELCQSQNEEIGRLREALEAIEYKAQQRTTGWVHAVQMLLDCKVIAGAVLSGMEAWE